MKITLVLASYLFSLAVLAGVPGAYADELVEIATHRAAAWPGSSEATPPLLGFLTRPNQPGRFPAVVLLHGCTGFSGHDTEAAATLKSWGYVALALNSLGDANMCGARGGAAAEAFDAYAGLLFLTAQSFVSSSRIAIMGYSMGALAALIAVESGQIEHAQQPVFRAVVAYYPLCQYSSGVLTAPALILIGERDDSILADACHKLAAHENDIGITRNTAAGTSIELVGYPEATPGFDVRSPPRRNQGLFEQYDEAASRDAARRVRVFLDRELGDQAAIP
jgi:dienelactone hydrolase